jgi:predicted phosphodiesterase
LLYGVFSDVHSNFEALTAVLRAFKDNGVEGHICCGDMVGYGPQPDACLDLIRNLKNPFFICGNHDLAIIGRMELEWFNPYARAAILWTRGVLSGESRKFLEVLTARLESPEFSLAHGTPRRPVEEYLLSAAQFRENMSRVRAWPLFVGHSHMPICFRQSLEGHVETIFLEDRQEVRVEQAPYGKVPVVFNPGSVGQPRDQDNRASCGIYDSKTGVFRLIRVDYDVAAVQAKIRRCGLPEYLALRLAHGQ